MATTPRRPAPHRLPSPLALLREDHRRIERLLKRFALVGGDQPARRALAEELCNELTVHADLEELEFYPLARQALAECHLLDEAEVEHEVARSLVEQLRSTSAEDERFGARVTVLGAYLRHHIAEEERVLFPLLPRSGIDFAALADRLVERRRQLRLSLGLTAPGATRPRTTLTVLPPGIIANAWRLSPRRHIHG